jgi:hypothetical protein
MSIFSFTNPLNGQKIEIEGPSGFTEAQARQIFEQQLKAGSFVGLKPGAIIDSASQLAGGLKTAASQVSQALTGIAGSAQGALTGAINTVTQAASALPSANLLASAQSVATKTLSGVTSAINNLAPTNPIDFADFATQALALVPIKGLDQIDVRAAMTQVTKLVDQSSNVLSNVKGLGSFGLDASQLEIAGVLKPGTAATYIESGISNLTSVLNSPSVWTGINGVTDVNSLLSSLPTQQQIQQQLMSTGLTAVQDLGIPINSLDPQALAGTALNAAKSIGDTMKWAQSLPLPSDIKNLFDTVSRDAAFAVNFAQQSANDAMRGEEPGEPATDTVDRATVDAASSRVVGSDKVPPVNVASSTPGDTPRAFSDSVGAARARFVELNNKASAVVKDANSDNDSNDAVRIVNSIDLLEALASDYLALKGTLDGLRRRADALEQATGSRAPDLNTLETLLSRVNSALSNIDGSIQRRKTKLETLKT